MATKESVVKRHVKAWLKARGIWFSMPIGSQFGNAGVPDFLCCANGRMLAIETKAPGRIKNTTAMQDSQLAAIRAAGGIAVVVDDVSQLEGIL